MLAMLLLLMATPSLEFLRFEVCEASPTALFRVFGSPLSSPWRCEEIKRSRFPSPQRGEGLGVRGAVDAASMTEERPKKISGCRKTSARCHGTAIPLTPRPLSPLGRGEPKSNVISIFSQLSSPALGRGEPKLFWATRNVDTPSMATPADLFSPHGEKAVVLLFVRTDCPVSNRYAPELQRLYERHAQQGVDFRLVYPEPGLTASVMEKHRKEYDFTIPALLDSNHTLVARARVRVTPEAAVFVRGQLIYRGRIDDRYVDIGKSRPEATRRDLAEVLAALAAGKNLRLRQSKAVGCAIEDLH
jgi:AhpC/TSA family protein